MWAVAGSEQELFHNITTQECLVSTSLHWEIFQKTQKIPSSTSVAMVSAIFYTSFLFHVEEEENNKMSLTDLIFLWQKRRGLPLRIPNEKEKL